MFEIDEIEIRRRADGSIDAAFYERRARSLWARECQARICSPWLARRVSLLPWIDAWLPLRTLRHEPSKTGRCGTIGRHQPKAIAPA